MKRIITKTGRLAATFLILLVALQCDIKKASQVPYILLAGLKGGGRPSVVLSSPSTLDHYVGVNVPIFVQFDRPMDHEVTQTSFTLTGSYPTPGTFRWEFNRLYYDLTQPLTPGGSYVLTIGGQATSTDGMRMQTEYIVHFVAGSRSDSPYVTGSSPINNSKTVTPTAPIQINFSRPMNRASVETAFSISPTVGGSFAWSPDSSSVTFTPFSPLTSGTSYSVSIGVSATDTSGIPLATVFTLTFQVGIDFIPPTILSVLESGNPTPLTNGMTGVSKDASFTIVFSEAMDYTVTNQCISLTRIYDNSTASGLITWNATFTQLTFKPNQPLEPENEYRLSVATCAKDLVGNNLAVIYNLGFFINNSAVLVNSNYLRITGINQILPGPVVSPLSLVPTVTNLVPLSATNEITLQIIFDHTVDKLTVPTNIYINKVMGITPGGPPGIGMITYGSIPPLTNNVINLVIYGLALNNDYSLELIGSRTGIHSEITLSETSTWMPANLKIFFKPQ